MQTLAVAPDGTWLASADTRGTIRLWNPVTGVLRGALPGHNAVVRSLTVAPDGTWLASVSDDQTLRVWDPITGSALAALRVDADLTVLERIPGSAVLAAAGGQHVYFLELIRPTDHLPVNERVSG